MKTTHAEWYGAPWWVPPAAVAATLPVPENIELGEN